MGADFCIRFSSLFISPENSFIWKFQEWNASVQINEVSLYSVQSLGVGMFSRLSRTSVTCEDDFSRNEDEEYDFGFDHAINEAREQLRLIAEKNKDFLTTSQQSLI